MILLLVDEFNPSRSQVVYRDTAARDVFVLYIITLHSGQRVEWMKLIRDGKLVSESEKTKRIYIRTHISW